MKGCERKRVDLKKVVKGIFDLFIFFLYSLWQESGRALAIWPRHLSAVALEDSPTRHPALRSSDQPARSEASIRDLYNARPLHSRLVEIQVASENQKYI